MLKEKLNLLIWRQWLHDLGTMVGVRVRLGKCISVLEHQVASEIRGTNCVAMAMVIILICRQRTFYQCRMECSNDQKNENK